MAKSQAASGESLPEKSPRANSFLEPPLPEVAHLEMLAQVDDLVSRLGRWAEPEAGWEPLAACRTLVRRLLGRLDSLRIRLESPLVVATFGGTGTGKSALVNALVGRDCTDSGRERPTTRQPILLAHPRTDLDLAGLPLDELRVVRCDSPLLRDIVLIDCPDPDTTETETEGSNLARLHRLLPCCDVLLYTSTQQKYRSARVSEELGQAAAGCRLVFVQTFADLDADVRDDWRRQLRERFEVPEMFLVDSLRSLREQQTGEPLTGDFPRLLELLGTQLSASQRAGIRRSNLLDLVAGTLVHCRTRIAAELPTVERLEQALAAQRVRLAENFSRSLRDELLASRSLWEQRLLEAVTRSWGLSPFAWVLRAWQGIGGLLTSAALFRARSAAQWALVGTVEGARRLRAWHREQQTDNRIEELGLLTVDAADLRESQLVIAGFVQEAHFDPQLIAMSRLETLQREAARAEEQFLGAAGRRIDEMIARLAAQNSRPLVRCGYEGAFVAMAGYLFGRSGWNFFYANPWLGEPLLTADYYLHAGIFLTLWSTALVMLFTRRLRRGLHREVAALSQELAGQQLAGGLFPDLEAACRDARGQVDRLAVLEQSTQEIRRKLGSAAALGRKLTMVPTVTDEPAVA
jgi:hypothetical protein